MIRIGLTGSIGMGKSTALKIFAELGAAVWDADAAVHRLYAKDGAAVRLVDETFPGVVVDGEIDRAALAKVVLSDPAQLEKLENIVHPLVGEDRAEFLNAAALQNVPAVVLDIPLLFENQAEALFDAVIVVSAPADVQRDRVLARPGMNDEKLAAILAQQMPDAEKQKRADYVISSDQPMEAMADHIASAYKKILDTGPRVSG